MCESCQTAPVHLPTRDGRSVLIRRLKKGDIPLLREFNEELSEESRNLFTPHPYDQQTLDEVVERARSGKDRVYVALAEGRVVGYFFLWHFDEPVPLLGIGIVDSYQNQGLGTKFMRLLIEEARRAQKRGIDLTTMQENDRAFCVYRKVGFQYVGEVENVAGDGRVVRERRMFLPLEEGAEPPKREFKAPV